MPYQGAIEEGGKMRGRTKAGNHKFSVVLGEGQRQSFKNAMEALKNRPKQGPA